MSKFKVGDIVRCVRFHGATGKNLEAKGRDIIYTVTEIKGEIYMRLDKFDGKVFTSRFALTDIPVYKMDGAGEYDEAIAAQDAMTEVSNNR